MGLVIVVAELTVVGAFVVLLAVFAFAVVAATV